MLRIGQNLKSRNMTNTPENKLQQTLYKKKQKSSIVVISCSRKALTIGANISGNLTR